MIAVSLPLFELSANIFKTHFKKENHPKKNNKGTQDGMTLKWPLLVICKAYKRLFLTWVGLQMYPAKLIGIHCTNPSAQLFFLRFLFGSQSTGSLLEGPELFLITLLFKRWHPSVSWQWFRYWTSLGSRLGEGICSSSLSSASVSAGSVGLTDGL